MKELFTVAQRKWPEEVLVEPSRLAMGIWGDTEGDIQAAYCGETFPKIKTFLHEGHLFTNCGGCAEQSVNCYPLVPESDYHGPEPRRYSYEGRAAKFKGCNFKLGPKVKFTIRPRSLADWVDVLRRQYAHGGYFAAGKTYHDVLMNFQERPLIPDGERKAIETELARPDLPVTQRLMLDRLHQKSGPTMTSKSTTNGLQLTLAVV